MNRSKIIVADILPATIALAAEWAIVLCIPGVWGRIPLLMPLLITGSAIGLGMILIRAIMHTSGNKYIH